MSEKKSNKENEEELEMVTKTPMKKPSIEQLLKSGLVIVPELDEKGRLVLDKDNPQHRRLMED